MNLFSIPAGADFLKTLADNVRRSAVQTQTPLSDYLILLPTRRAVRTLTQLFFPKTGAALIPRIHALGDLDDDVLTLQSPDMELPPAIHPTARLGLLIKLIREQEDMPWARALALAKALAMLLDEAIIRNVSLMSLADKIPGELARHWEKTAVWLQVISQRWPDMLAARGQIDASDLRQRILKSYAALWQKNPPTHPIIAAGSTGSLPATRELLRVIASLSHGKVIFPALDMHMPEAIFETVPENHPQNALRNLLADFGKTRADVQMIGAAESPHAALWHEVLLPPDATARWRAPERRLIKSEKDAGILQNLHTATAPNGEVEANVITLILHQAMVEQKSAALVTPDRALAQRVAAKLHRFGITANDSAGQTLAQSPAGRWVRLLLQSTLHGNPAQHLFYLLRHPFSCFGAARDVCRTAVRDMESKFFHQSGSPADLASVLARPDTNLPLRDGLSLLLDAPKSGTLADWSLWLCGVSEKLTAAPDSAPLIWQEEAGENLITWLDQLLLHSDHFGTLSADEFEEFCEAEFESITLHPPSTHPNLQILGPLEARLHGFDVVVLGGLNENTWPASVSPDPWLSRQMRHEIVLGLPDERIGLAANDFLQLAAQPCVYLTRSLMQDGAPTLPSRWWQRLSAYLKACGMPDNYTEDYEWLAKAEVLDQAKDLISSPRPAPSPTKRPHRFSPSSLKTLMRNPYEFYAKKILNLYDLPELIAPPKESDQGNLFHDMLAEFVRQYPATMPAGAAQILDDMAMPIFAGLALSAIEREFWWQNYTTARDNFLGWQESALAAGRRTLFIEQDISRELGHVTLHARADRVDIDADGNWIIVDYKRANPPSKTDILELREPQLVMEGWILSAPISGQPRAVGGGEIWPLLADAHLILDSEKFQTAIAEFPARITPFIEHYLNPENPYPARIIKNPFENELFYQHLARAVEWRGAA